MIAEAPVVMLPALVELPAPASPWVRPCTCKTKRVATIRTLDIAANVPALIVLEKGVAAYSVRVVDATTFAAVAWTLGYEADPNSVRHFAATAEPYTENDLGQRFGPLALWLGAAVAARAELIVWKG